MSEKEEEHQCTRQDLVENNRPVVESHSISLIYKCRICGRQYEKVYTPIRNDGWLYDPVKTRYVTLTWS